jgi:hypothetical protein
MNRLPLLSAAVAAALAAGVASAQVYTTYPTYSTYPTYPTYTTYPAGYDGMRIVRCESVDSRRTFCRVDTRGGVQLTRQLSRQACVRGRNWVATRDGISVADGCRADFAVNTGRGSRYQAYNGAYTYDRYGRRVYTYANTGYYGNGNTIHCQSNGHGRTYCGVRGSHYALVDRSPSCIAERTVGDDDYGTWVSGYCNADFALRTYPVDQGYYDPADTTYYRNRTTTPYEYGTTPGVYTPGYDTYDNGQQVVYCQSTASGRTYCGDAGRAYSLRYGSNAYCVEGRTYGRDRYGTWVSGGCNLTLEPEYEQ